ERQGMGEPHRSVPGAGPYGGADLQVGPLRAGLKARPSLWKMCRCLVLGAGCLVLGVASLAAQAPASLSPDFKRTSVATSPKGDFTVEYYGGPNNAKQIWLAPKAAPAQRVWLFSYERDARVLVSPDERWLIIN